MHEFVTEKLWPQGHGTAQRQAYALLDGARDSRIELMVRQSGLPHCCLFAGPLSEKLSAAAPYLVQITPETRLFKELMTNAWSQAWGIFALADAGVTIEQLRKHFRALLRVRDEHGETLVFRYYDPRVLRAFIPTCNRHEADVLYGPVCAYALESAEGDALQIFERGTHRPEIRRDTTSRGGSLTVRDEQMAVLHRESMVLRLHEQYSRRALLRGPEHSPRLAPTIAALRDLVNQAEKAGLTRPFTMALYVMLVSDEDSPFHRSPDALTLMCRGSDPDSAMGALLVELYVSELSFSSANDLLPAIAG